MRIFVFLVFICSYSLSAQVDSLLADADHLYQQESYEEALKLYAEVLAEDSLNHGGLLNAGLSAFKLGDLVIAKKHLLQLVKTDSTNKSVLVRIANIYEQEKNTPKAIKYYHKLISAFPDDPIMYRKLAQQYSQAGLRRDAIKYYQTAFELNPRDQYTIKGLAEIYLYEKNYPKTDSTLWDGLQLDSTNIQMLLLISNSKYRQKAYDSVVHYMEAIRGRYDLRPHHNKMVGYAYLQVDSLDKAIRYLTKAIGDPGTKEYAHYHLGVAYEKQKDMEFAIHHYSEAVKAGISKDIDLYHRNTARLMSAENDLKSAIPHYQDAYKYSEDPILLFYLGRAADGYYKDKSIAIRYYQRYAKSGHDNEEYIVYAKKRVRYLKEIQHQSQ